MRLLSELALRHAGRPAVVMGGGESLPEHLSRCPENAIYLSANQHGAMLRKADFIVSIDDNEDDLRPLGTPIIGRRHWCDFRIQDWIDFQYCGPTACWIGWVLGGRPVIAAGMNCYQGGTYHHDASARSTGNLVSLEEHLERWRYLARAFPHAWIRSCGGPTADIFPLWDPDEVFPEYLAPPELEEMRALHPVRARTQECARLSRKPVPAGMELLLSPNEYLQMRRRRTVVPI